ncbi:MAG: creatininase family protein [Chitinispirillaceae bacterium]|nr:creatininase family protein [Chitinispirillaceae bacterium]
MISNNNSHTFEIKIESLSINEIEDFIKTNPSLIIPIGGYEPLGKEMIVNGFNLCCEKIAETYATQNRILMSPIIKIGYTIPFKGFGGCTGISKDSLRDVILDTCNSWIFMGVKRILLITTATYNLEAIQPAVERINRKHKIECVKFFSLQHNEEFRSFCELHFEVKGYKRYECGMLALLNYFYPEIFKGKDFHISPHIQIPDIDRLKRWEHLGKDPNKLRNLAPNGLLSDIRGKNITRESGKLLFDNILETLNKKYYSFLTKGEYDS